MRTKSYITLVTALVIAATHQASAVLVELASPQDGQEVFPGQTISASWKITNDTDAADEVVVAVAVNLQGFRVPWQGEWTGKFTLQPGQSMGSSLSIPVPTGLKLEEPVLFTVTVTGVGKTSGTSSSDALTFKIMPVGE